MCRPPALHGQGNPRRAVGSARVPHSGVNRPETSWGGGTRREGPSHRAGALAACGLMGLARATRSLARRTAATGSDAGDRDEADGGGRGLVPAHPGADRGCHRPHRRPDRAAGRAGHGVLHPQDGRRPRRRRPVRRPRRHPALQLVRPDVVEPRRGDRRLAGAGKGPPAGRTDAGGAHHRHADPGCDQPRHRGRDPHPQHADRRRRRRRLQPGLPAAHAHGARRPRDRPGGRGGGSPARRGR